MTKLNKNDRVRLTDIDPRVSGLGLWLNQEGTVVSTRHLPEDKEPKVLVQWDGYRGHISLDQSMVESLTKSGQPKTYQILINEQQRELISRALNHLYEVDIEFHEDLAQDIEGEPKLVLTEKGKDLEYLYKMFGDDSLEQDGGLFSGDTLNGIGGNSVQHIMNI